MCSLEHKEVVFELLFLLTIYNPHKNYYHVSYIKKKKLKTISSLNSKQFATTRSIIQGKKFFTYLFCMTILTSNSKKKTVTFSL